MKRANKSGAEVAVIVGEDEAAEGQVAIKPLRGQGDQHRVPVGQLLAAVQEYLR